jgi:hypothetical protein
MELLVSPESSQLSNLLLRSMIEPTAVASPEFIQQWNDIIVRDIEE